MPSSRPTAAELRAAIDRTVPDILAPGLDVLFCGINPGLYSAAVGHHFARPGNRFWPALHAAGFTPHQLDPREDRRLLDLGLGITNVVGRTTASASELTAEELRRGGRRLRKKVQRFRPRFLAVLGIEAYRQAFQPGDGQLGRQAETVDGTVVWVLPNPSGLNAHYRLSDFVRLFGELRQAAREGSPLV